MKKLSLAAVIVLAMMALGGVAQAHDERERGRGRNIDARNYGERYGYEDGYQHGRQDRLRRIGYSVRSREYQRGDRGYQKHMGAKGQYKQGYRAGYTRGYDDGYRGRGVVLGRGRYPDGGYPDRRYPDGRYPDGRYPDERYPDGDRGVLGTIDDAVNGRARGGYGDVAYERGYREGVKDGKDDGEDRDRYNPQGHGDYKDADDGYNSRYGSKEAYRANFRRGYLAGYDESYRRYNARR
jgi:hypothetical protein